jgi:hypothetical protein
MPPKKKPTITELEARIEDLTTQNARIVEQLNLLTQQHRSSGTKQELPQLNNGSEIPRRENENPVQERNDNNWTVEQFKNFTTPAIRRTLFTTSENGESPKGIPNSTFKKFKKKTKELLLNHPNLLDWSIDEVSSWIFNICSGTTEEDHMEASKTANICRINRIDGVKLISLSKDFGRMGIIFGHERDILKELKLIGIDSSKITCDLKLDLSKEKAFLSLQTFSEWIDSKCRSKFTNEWFKWILEATCDNKNFKNDEIRKEIIAKCSEMSFIEAHPFIIKEIIFKNSRESLWFEVLTNLKPSKNCDTFGTFIPYFVNIGRSLQLVSERISDTFLIETLKSKFPNNIKDILDRGKRTFETLDEFIEGIKDTFPHSYDGIVLDYSERKQPQKFKKRYAEREEFSKTIFNPYDKEVFSRRVKRNQYSHYEKA